MKKLREQIFTEKSIYIFLAIISMIRILIQFKLPLSINVDQTADDGLLQRLALSLHQGDYLGKYDYLTLCKNNMYSYILAFCYKTMIPYALVISLLNIGSAYAICRAFDKHLSRTSRYIIYVLILYGPVTFSNLTALRVYRNSVLPYMVLFVFAGFIALYLRKDTDEMKELWPWTILECICLPVFWYMKEDSIWIMPFCLAITILAVIWMLVIAHEISFERVIAFVLPFIALIAVTLALMVANYTHYGVATTNDRSNTAAGHFYASLLMIEDDDVQTDDSVWVSNETLSKVAEVSPTFASIYQEMQASSAFAADGQIHGDHYIWKIRYVMDQMGYYDSAVKANDAYKQMNSDIEEAFESGALVKDDLIHLSSQMKGLTFKEILSFVPKAIKNMGHVSTYADLQLENLGSHGDITKLTTQQYLLGSNTFKEHTLDFQMEARDYQLHFANHVNRLIALYQKPAKLVDLLCMLAFVLYFIFMVRDMIVKHDYKGFDMFVVLCGIILSAFVVSWEVELFMDWFDTDSYNSFVEFYSVSMYPLISVFKYLSIALIVEKLVKRKKCYNR